jgi:7-carboxy-7-deazaguanine synthase
MWVKDIFYSFQGEGPYIGVPQIFFRFYGCNIHCAYCDEPDFSHQRKNYTLTQALAELAPLIAKKPHSISITGGEPMLQTEAIVEIATHVDVPLYLETNATMPEKLEALLPYISYYSVDYKPGFLKECTAFIAKIADYHASRFRQTGDRPKGYRPVDTAQTLQETVFVKLVLTPGFSPDETASIAKAIADLGIQIPFIIQPVTPFGTVQQKASMQDIELNFAAARQWLSDVRIIGQTHKLIGVR